MSLRQRLAKKRPKNSESAWEYAHFKHLLNLRIIMLTYLDKLYPEKKSYTRSFNFFANFIKFAKDNSSPIIPRFLDPLTDEENQAYLKLKSL